MTQPAFRFRPMIYAGGALLALAALATVAAGSAAAAPSPAGTWRTEDGRARVRVEPCGSGHARMCGYIVWLQDLTPDGRGGTDRRNPDPSRAGRPILGHQMMLGLAPLSDGRYQGKVYNAEDGRSYDVEVWQAEEGTLKVRGCMLIFCKTETWTRAVDVAQGQLVGPTGSPTGPRPDPEWAPPPGPDRRGSGRRS